MTEPSEPSEPSELDDLASAHLDGATTAEEAALLAADPAGPARLEALERVRRELRAGLPVDETAREAALSAALDAFDEEAEAAPVTDLSAVAARRGASPRTLRVLGVAAALLLLAALVPLLGQVGSTDDDVAASGGESFAETGEALDAAGGATPDTGTDDEAEPQIAADAEATEEIDAADTDDLGAFADLEALLVAARQATARAGLSPTSTSTAAEPSATVDDSALARLDPCAAAVLDGPTAQPPLVARTATLDGRPVLVVASGPSAQRTVSVISLQPCALLAQVPE